MCLENNNKIIENSDISKKAAATFADSRKNQTAQNINNGFVSIFHSHTRKLFRSDVFNVKPSLLPLTEIKGHSRQHQCVDL